jgi:hypothetical protein
VRNDVAANVPKLSAADAWRSSSVRESRCPDGRLTFQSPAALLKEIGDLPVVDVASGQRRPIRETVDAGVFTR